jgi:hypothetical protein
MEAMIWQNFNFILNAYEAVAYVCRTSRISYFPYKRIMGYGLWLMVTELLVELYMAHDASVTHMYKYYWESDVA